MSPLFSEQQLRLSPGQRAPETIRAVFFRFASRTVRTAGIVLGCVCALALVGGAALWYLARQAPEFYRQAVLRSPAQRDADARQFLRHTSQLLSDIENERRWEAAFTQEQVNGWLAEDFVQDHASLLPPSIAEPRVAFHEGSVTLAFCARRGLLTTVVSLELACWVPEPNLLAVQLRRTRAGAVPVSIQGFLRRLAEESPRRGWNIEWKRSEGMLVALVRLALESEGNEPVLDEIDVRDGILYLAGTSRDRDAVVRGRELPARSAHPAEPPLSFRSALRQFRFPH